MSEDRWVDELVKRQAKRLGIAEHAVRSKLVQKPSWLEVEEQEAQNVGLSLERFLVDKYISRKNSNERSL